MGFANWVRCGLLILAVGCLKRQPSGEEALDRALAAADAAWDARTEDLSPVRTALQAAAAIAPESPKVLWRFARLEIAAGLIEPERAQRVILFGRARSHAWRCVLGDAVVQSVRLESGLEEALVRLKPDRHDCATWLFLAWSRWYGDFGPDAASLDRQRFEALRKVGLTFDGETLRARVTWAQALVDAAEGRPGGLAAVRDPIARVDEIRFGSDDAARGQLERPILRSPEGNAYLRWVLAGAGSP